MSSAHWNVVKQRLLGHLSEDRATALWIRAGVVLPLDEQIINVVFGPYMEGEGRRMQRHSLKPDGLKLEMLMREALRSTSSSNPAIRTRDIVLGQYDCFSIAPLSDSQLRAIIDLFEGDDRIEFWLSFDATDVLHRRFFWDCLTESAFVTQGETFVQYEDAPESFLDFNDEVRFVPDIANRRPIRGAWFFSTSGGALLLERDAPEIVPPGDLPAGHLSDVARDILHAITPAERVGRALLTTSTARISPRDQGQSDASTVLPDAGGRFPNFESTRRKILDYCLSSDYPKRPGFLRFGYGWCPERDASILAGEICAALTREFPIIDPRANADSTVQFSVPVAVLTSSGTVMRLLTSWVFSYESPPSLATAFVVGQQAFDTWASPLPFLDASAIDLQSITSSLTDHALRSSRGFLSFSPLASWQVAAHEETGSEDVLDILKSVAEGLEREPTLVIETNDDGFFVAGDAARVEALARSLQYSLARMSLRVKAAKVGNWSL